MCTSGSSATEPERPDSERPRGQRPRQPTQEEIAEARARLEELYLAGRWVGSHVMTPTTIIKRPLITEASGVVKGPAWR